MMQRPFIPLTVALILGITLGNYVYLPDCITLICLVILLVTVLFLNKTKPTAQVPVNTETIILSQILRGLNHVIEIINARTGFIMPVVLASLFLIGMLNINLYLHPMPGPGHIIHYADKKAVMMEGIIIESPQFSPDKTELILAAANIIEDGNLIPVEGRTIITIKGYYPFKYGDFLRFAVNLKTPHNFHNPGGFDYEKYLLYQRIMVRGFISDPEKIVIMRQNQGNRIKAFIENFRMKLKTIIYENAESPQKEIIQAMILGDQKEISRDIMEKFNRTGVSHIIAISGFNVGMIAVFSLFVIRLILKSSETFLLRYSMIAVSTWLSLIPVIIFCLIAGLGVSVVRATIMAVVFMAAILIGRQRDLYNTLALAAFIILIIAPYSLFDVSFQLSFAAVFALLFITPRVSHIFSSPWVEEKKDQHPRTVQIVINSALFVAVTLSATLGTLPLIIFYFNRFSNVVLPANICVVPVLGILAIPVSMAIILTAPISASLAIPFIYVCSILVTISLKIVDFFDSIPGASWIVTTPTVIEIFAYYILLFALVSLLDRKDEETKKKYKIHISILKLTCLCLCLFFAVYNIYLYTQSKQNHYVSMTAIDVGQGSAALFRLPGGKTLLIDGGGFADGSFDIGKNVVAPFLLHQRIKKIDYVILTHPHPDHLGGLIYILDNFAVREVWSNGQSSQTQMYQQFIDILKKKSIVHRVLSEDTGTFFVNGVAYEILNPEHPLNTKMDASEKYDLVNDNSLVMKISFGKIAFLLTADIGSDVEERLISAGKDMRSAILLVAHHGGFRSSTRPFLHQVHPHIAVISCGKDNIYHDPHPDVLRRFREIETKVLRTDKNGAVTVKTDGVNIVAETFTPI